MRWDIQALRGWAVGLVLLDHVGIGPFAHGYLGVDIFFVISGFLITGIISRDVAAGTFSFGEFYFRRVKRLLPAAYVTILLTILGANWFLTSLEMQDLTSQVFGALTWTTNFVLLAQTDYFAGAADLKPLLHMWSLAVEEQFYLAMPVLLFFTPARFWRMLIVALFSASVLWCAYLVGVDQSEAFYMLPSRAWELALGGIGALFAFNNEMATKVLRFAFWPALGVMAIVPIWSTGYPHPGMDALLVCVATLVIILRRHETFGRVTNALGLVKLGDISYSLYLVHWPIVAFINNAYIGEPTIEYRLAALVLSLCAAAAMYYVIERPIHRAKALPSMRNAVAALTATIMLAGFQYSANAASGTDFAHLRRPNHGLDAKCDGGRSLTEVNCRTSDSPEVFIWGDSYAMHLVPGIVAVAHKDIRQATLSACMPIVALAYYREGRSDPEAWAKMCMSANDKALAAIAESASVKTVVMSSPFRGLDMVDVLVRREDGEIERVKSTTDLALKELQGTIRSIQKLGKKVVLVGPPPTSGKDAGLCVERKVTGKVTFGPHADCLIAREGSEQPSVMALLSELKKLPGLKVVDLHDALCDDRVCQTSIKNVAIYRDAGHLSYAGSVEVMRAAGMGAILAQ